MVLRFIEIAQIESTSIIPNNLTITILIQEPHEHQYPLIIRLID